MSSALKDRLGCEIFEASDANSASIRIKTVKLDLLITELLFNADPFGIKICEFVRTYEKNKDVPILIYTNKIDKKTVLVLKDLKIKDVLLKPTDQKTFFVKVADILLI